MRLYKGYKAVTILLALCMLFSSVVFAADGQTRIYSDEKIVAEQGIVTVPVYIENNPGIFKFTVSIQYDKNVLEPVPDSEVKGDVAPMVLANPSYMDKPDTRVGCVHASNFSGDGLLFTYQYRVKEGATGQTTLNIGVTENSVRRLEENLETTVVKCEGSTTTVLLGDNPTPPTSAVTTPPTAAPTEPHASLKADAASIRYMAPVSETSFAPERPATRYEVVEALYALLDFQNIADMDRFPDVDDAHKAMVNALAQTPILDGYPDGTFGGANNITRAEFVKMMSVAAGMKIGENIGTGFSDVTGHWGQAYIAAFVDASLIYGYPDGTFKPDNNVTRAEVVAIINRVIGTEKADAAAQRFDDLTREHWAYGDIMAVAK